VIRVGIVGYGYAGRNFHSYLVPLAEGLRLEAIASSSPEKRAQIVRERGCRAVETPEQLFADPNIDLVVLATPHDTHARLAIAALEAGKHVVTDKVMCLSLAEADAMIAAARRAGKLLSVFQNRRWDWDYATVRKIIADGLIGRPYLFECAVLGSGMPRGWRADPARCGTVLHDWGAHLVDQALQLVPAPVVEVFCHIAHVRPEPPIGNFGKLVLRFADGTLFDICCGNLARQGKPRWYVLGERGSIVREGMDPQEAAMNRGDIDAAREDPAGRARVRTTVDGLPVELVVETVRTSWKSYYQNISDTLHGKAELAVTPESVRRSIAVYEAAAQAVATGRSVAVHI
jgi:scyllo-inositol 2-dehydrogenase (NADP+)